MMKKKPLLIVFEGIDGSGKTTLSRMLLDDWQKQGRTVVWLREPSASPWGEKIRAIAQAHDQIPIREELEYFIEDRRWNVKNCILPALDNNQDVILDRYYYSTACYQGARGLDMDEIIRLNEAFAPRPDAVFIVDVDVEIAMQRIRQNRETTVKLFEKKEFLLQVRENYLKLKGEHIHVLDGSLPLAQVFVRLLEKIADYLLTT